MADYEMFVPNKPAEPTAMALAFERAVQMATRGGSDLTNAERQAAADALTELHYLRGEVKRLSHLASESEVLIDLAEAQRTIHEMRNALGEQKTLTKAAERARDLERGRADKYRSLYNATKADLEDLKIEREKWRAESRESVRVWGFAFPDEGTPLPLHFGRTQGDALRFATVSDPEFRESHDPDLEFVECEVRVRPGGRRALVGASHQGWKRETRIT